MLHAPMSVEDFRRVSKSLHKALKGEARYASWLPLAQRIWKPAFPYLQESDARRTLVQRALTQHLGWGSWSSVATAAAHQRAPITATSVEPRSYSELFSLNGPHAILSEDLHLPIGISGFSGAHSMGRNVIIAGESGTGKTVLVALLLDSMLPGCGTWMAIGGDLVTDPWCPHAVHFPPRNAPSPRDWWAGLEQRFSTLGGPMTDTARRYLFSDAGIDGFRSSLKRGAGIAIFNNYSRCPEPVGRLVSALLAVAGDLIGTVVCDEMDGLLYDYHVEAPSLSCLRDEVWRHPRQSLVLSMQYRGVLGLDDLNPLMRASWMPRICGWDSLLDVNNVDVVSLFPRFDANGEVARVGKYSRYQNGTSHVIPFRVRPAPMNRAVDSGSAAAT